MFKNTFQSGFLSILYSIGSKPLQIWDKKVRNGHIKRITDPDIQSFVLEIVGTNVSTTYITCPADPRKTLGIKLPYLVMIVKNMKKYFTFEVQVRSNLMPLTLPLQIQVDILPSATYPFYHLYRCLTTKMSDEDFEHQITNQPQGLNLLFALCQ